MIVLANFYYNQEKYERAEPSYRLTLESCSVKFGADHPDTLKSINDLADVYGALGKNDDEEAEQICGK